MNNSQEIILAQISAIYDKPPFVKVKTGQMEMILKCVGLGKYYDEYAKYLEPYWYNRGFQNDIESYRIFVGLNSIFEDLLNAHSLNSCSSTPSDAEVDKIADTRFDVVLAMQHDLESFK